MQAAHGTAIVQAVPEDAPALERLAQITFPLACPPTSLAEDIRQFLTTSLAADNFREWIADPAATVLVAPSETQATGELAIDGFTVVLAEEPSDPEVAAVITPRPVLELSKIYVHPARHGRGTAASLMAAIIEVATGSSGLWLGVNQQNLRAQTFYRRNGFEVVGTKHFQLGTVVEDDFVMFRPVAHPSPGTA